ncbi:MAG: DoxX family protein [Roseiflexaceae bacterium]
MQSQWARLRESDATLTEGMAKIAIPLLRVSLAITYIWFGALKLAGRSPVADLVSQTAPMLPKRWFVRTLGLWEVAIGLALLLRVALRPTLLLFFGQMAGTFLTFVMRPERMFQQGNPLLLTKDGEFVLKNLVLLSAGLAVGSTVRREHEEVPATD